MRTFPAGIEPTFKADARQNSIYLAKHTLKNVILQQWMSDYCLTFYGIRGQRQSGSQPVLDRVLRRATQSFIVSRTRIETTGSAGRSPSGSELAWPRPNPGGNRLNPRRSKTMRILRKNPPNQRKKSTICVSDS